MYWLLPLNEQEEIRDKITQLATELSLLTNRVQNDQVFPFVGRKDRRTARAIIRNLSNINDTIADPMSGSGIFAYAGLDEGRKVLMNEWEPFAYRLSTAPFRSIPSEQEIDAALERLDAAVGIEMRRIYRTICTCGREHVFDGLFYDRDPEEYYKPTSHERMGNNGENVIFRGKYKCVCGVKQKCFDDSDMAHLLALRNETVVFPDIPLIENSRINFTAPHFVSYKSLFPHRSQLALEKLHNAIQGEQSIIIRETFIDAFLSILHLAKYCDYRSKSQDPHCPPVTLKENNIYHRFIENVKKRNNYLRMQPFHNLQTNLVESCQDFRDFLDTLTNDSVQLLITDPPYGDSVQYFELAQRFQPYMGYSLSTDRERLEKEIVVSNARIRTDKRDRDQFLLDIEKIFKNSYQKIKDHGYLVLYFRPEQTHWVSDLNRLKVFGRKHGFEPLITIDVAQNDPSMRVLASTAWTFAKDVCFVFLKLRQNERRWYENDVDVDELVYVSARQASGERGQPFTKQSFNSNLLQLLRQHNLIRLSSPQYAQNIENTLLRFCDKQGAQYMLTGESPYEHMHFGIDAELRMREFIPIVVEELTATGEKFTFEEFILRLSTYLDNGNRTIIERLHQVNRLIPELLLQHAEVDADGQAFVARSLTTYVTPVNRTNVLLLDPNEFEHLVAEYFRRRGFLNVRVIGQANDRGVDVLANGSDGTLHLIQCKRYRPGNNVGSNPIQRVDSYKRTRGADQAWVITTSDFTREGSDEARITGVRILNGSQFMESLEIYFPNVYYIPR
ncbi:restriction endonuclease [Paenibacillus humicus]|uniref:restriction endonuclease n=1 Tax=Paenibacillus humicus TaxID=412861 RepID=UPI003D29D6FC